MRNLHIPRVRDSKTPDFCEDCRKGNHYEACRRGLGCLKVVAKQPKDYVCKCKR